MGSTTCCKLAYLIGLIIMASLLSLPIAHALTCSNVAEKDLELCNEIILSNATNDEKQQLIADLIYTNTNYANHNLIYDWNTNINFNLAPNGVETKSNGYIKDAWLKIIAILPSVISENKLLSPGTGKVLSAYNYNVQIPSKTEPGDCKTEFTLKSNDKWLNVYLNDELTGTSTLTDFEGYDVLNFKDTLKIQTVTEVEHYQTYKWCCKYSKNGGCAKFCDKCKYENTEYRTHQVNLEDSKQAYQYSPLIEPEIRAIDSYRNTTVGILSISNFDAFSLNFENSSFKQFNHNYDVDVSLQPYDVFTLRTNNFTRKDANNIIVSQITDNYKFYVANPESCQLKYYDHFHSWEQTCNLETNFPLFEVETDKLFYDENEEINVNLEPKDTLIKVKYGNEELLVKNKASFIAKKNVNKITAYLDYRETQKIIHVKKENIWVFVLNFGVFTGILYFYYLLIKKYVFWI